MSHFTCLLAVFALSLLAFFSPARILASGGAGVGITEPPDKVGVEDPLPAGTCTFQFRDCELPPSQPGSHPDFHRSVVLDFNARIDADLDIHYSQSFADFGWPVDDDEQRALARALDLDLPDSPLGYGPQDLPLIFNYYSLGDTLYGQFNRQTNPVSQFFFDRLFASYNWPLLQRNHVDVYLHPICEKSMGCVTPTGCPPTTCGGNPCPTCCAPPFVPAGTWPAVFNDDDEDEPFSDDPIFEKWQANPPTCVDEFGSGFLKDNSIGIWDHWGNACNYQDWWKATAVTFDHEFQHLLKGEYSFGAAGGAADEFFSTTAEYLAGATYPLGIPSDAICDICYDLPFPIAGLNYPIWRSWGVYLLQHFQNGLSFQDDLVYEWNRTRRTGVSHMQGLAQVLEDPKYNSLQCISCPSAFRGQYRLQEVNNRIAVARWVDDPSLRSGIYDYPNFSPGRDLGLYRKIQGTVNCDYSHTVPPVFLLDSSDLNAPTTIKCYVDPRDPPCPNVVPGCSSPDFCTLDGGTMLRCNRSEGCGDTVDMAPWGADVIGFVAGLNFTDGDYYELQTTLRFGAVPGFDCHPGPGAQPCSYRYFVNLVTYNSNDTLEPNELWDKGSHVTSVSTYGPFSATSPRDLQFVLGDFGCPLIRSVAFVISLADSVALEIPDEWHRRPRLDYEYEYTVTSPNPEGPHSCPGADPGCPFVFVQGPGELLRDNNLLGEAGYYVDHVPNEPDMRDEYVLSRPVELQGGRVVLEIREEDQELSSLDVVGLVAYDLPEGADLARRIPDSQVGLTVGTQAILGVRNRLRQDVSAILQAADGEVITGDDGDYVEFEWVNTAQIGPQIIIVHPKLKNPPLPPGGNFVGDDRAGIILQVDTGRGNWNNVAEFVPRDRGENLCVSTSEIPAGLPGQVVPLRLVWRGHHELDWLAFGTWIEIESTALPLLEATHSNQGDVRAQLLAADGQYATLGARESIRLGFGGYQAVPGRRLGMVVSGHYVIPQGFAPGAPGSEFRPAIYLREEEGVAPIVAPTPESNRVSVYPNPARGSATMNVQVSWAGDAQIAVYSADGHLVRRLHSGFLAAGAHEITWDGRNTTGRRVSSGQYFYRVEVGSWVETGSLPDQVSARSRC